MCLIQMAKLCHAQPFAVMFNTYILLFRFQSAFIHMTAFIITAVLRV